MQRIVFYSDSETFGGNQMQMAKVAEAASGLGYDVTVLYRAAALKNHLTPAAEMVHLTRPATRWSRQLGIGGRSAIKKLSAELKGLAPNLLIVDQGNIQMGLTGILAGRDAGCHTVSYLPFGHKMSEIGARWGRLRDHIAARNFMLPDGYITSSVHHRTLLARLTDSPIYVIRYPISTLVGRTVPERLPDRAQLRVGVVGRIYFRHKNQDSLVKVAQIIRRNGGAVEFVIIGDGPDRMRLERKIARDHLGGTITLRGWMSHSSLLADAVDLFDVWMIPSYFEGVPTVLLEAATMRIPFLISRLPFVTEYGIPDILLLDPKDPCQIAERIVALPGLYDPVMFDTVTNGILSRHSPDNFAADVSATLSALV